jgi:pseudouridine kinase
MTILDFTNSPDAPVLVIGAAGVDVVGQLDRSLQSGTSTPANIRFSFGGVARNVAENLSRLGHPVRLITTVGSGYFGDQLLHQVEDAGVDVGYSIRTDEPTSSYVAVLSQGEKQFAFDDMRGISALTPTILRDHYHLFKDSSLVFLDANLPEATLKTIFYQARRAGLPVVADPTSTTLAPRLIPFLSQLKMITPNSSEAAIFCDQAFEDADQSQALEASKHLVSQGVTLSIITLAEFGVVYATSETSGSIPAIRTEIEDPTGAGDALTASVIFALLNDIPLDDAVRLGVSAASLTLRHRGAVLPDLSLERLYDQLVI